MLNLLRLSVYRLDVPDTLGVFVDTAVGAEETHTSNTTDTFAYPLFLVPIFFINQLVGVDI